MKYTNSIFTPNFSGKQGNTVFSNNMYGPYSCERRIPTDPKTDAQQTVRSGTALIARMWEMLTPAQRLNWCNQAENYPFQKKGKSYFLSGFMFFMKLNRNLYEVNVPPSADFPSQKHSLPQDFTSFHVELINTPTGPDLLMYFTPSIDTNTKIKLSATNKIKVTELYGTHKTRKIAVLDSSFVSGSSIKDYYIKKYEKLPGLMSKAFFDIKSININSGFSTSPVNSEVYGI